MPHNRFKEAAAGHARHLPARRPRPAPTCTIRAQASRRSRADRGRTRRRRPLGRPATARGQIRAGTDRPGGRRLQQPGHPAALRHRPGGLAASRSASRFGADLPVGRNLTDHPGVAFLFGVDGRRPPSPADCSPPTGAARPATARSPGGRPIRSRSTRRRGSPACGPISAGRVPRGRSRSPPPIPSIYR